MSNKNVKLNNSKVLRVESSSIFFDNGVELTSEHDTDCCESHYLSFDDLALDDFDGLSFDLSTDKFFRRVEGYGIELLPISGFSIKVPGYGQNNGYYSCNLDLVINMGDDKLASYDIEDCQDITE